jgi:hypothetical protein
MPHAADLAPVTDTLQEAPVIQRSQAWHVVDATSNEYGSFVMLHDVEFPVRLEEVPIGTAESQVRGDDPLTRQREALTVAVDRMLQQEAAGEHPRNELGTKFWVAFGGLHKAALSAAKLHGVTRSSEGALEVEVIDRQGDIVRVPTGEPVRLFTERQRNTAKLARLSLVHHRR